MLVRKQKRVQFLIKLLVLSTAALTTMAHPVEAASPSVQKISIDTVFVDDELSAACGFLVTHEEVRNLKIFTYADGTQKYVLAGVNYDVYSGPGGSLSAPQSGKDVYTVSPDGTILTDVATGNFGMVTVPGAGPVLLGAGKLVTVFDLVTQTVVSRTQHGNFRAPNYVAFCGALAG